VHRTKAFLVIDTNDSFDALARSDVEPGSEIDVYRETPNSSAMTSRGLVREIRPHIGLDQERESSSKGELLSACNMGKTDRKLQAWSM